MNEDTLLKLVDKLAEKLGVAVEEIQPLAEEVVRQVQLKGVAYTVFSLLLLLLASVLGYAACRALKHAASDKCSMHNEEVVAGGGIVLGILALLAAIGGSLSLLEGLCLYLAPLPSILGL